MHYLLQRKGLSHFTEKTMAVKKNPHTKFLKGIGGGLSHSIIECQLLNEREDAAVAGGAVDDEIAPIAF